MASDTKRQHQHTHVLHGFVFQFPVGRRQRMREFHLARFQRCFPRRMRLACGGKQQLLRLEPAFSGREFLPHLANDGSVRVCSYGMGCRQGVAFSFQVGNPLLKPHRIVVGGQALRPSSVYFQPNRCELLFVLGHLCFQVSHAGSPLPVEFVEFSTVCGAYVFCRGSMVGVQLIQRVLVRLALGDGNGLELLEFGPALVPHLGETGHLVAFLLELSGHGL